MVHNISDVMTIDGDINVGDGIDDDAFIVGSGVMTIGDDINVGDGIDDDAFIADSDVEDCNDDKYSKYHCIIQQITNAIPNANNIYSVFVAIV